MYHGFFCTKHQFYDMCKILWYKMYTLYTASTQIIKVFGKKEKHFYFGRTNPAWYNYFSCGFPQATCKIIDFSSLLFKKVHLSFSENVVISM